MKHLGLIAMVFVGLLGVFLLKTWKGGDHITISGVAAGSKNSRILFFLALVLGAMMFGVFSFFWYIPEYNFGLVFKFLLIIGLVSQFSTAYFPEEKSIKGLIHFFSALILGLSLIGMSLLISFSQNISFIGRTFALVSSFIMVVLFFMIILIKNKNLINLEILYVLIFWATIFITTYI